VPRHDGLNYGKRRLSRSYPASTTYVTKRLKRRIQDWEEIQGGKIGKDINVGGFYWHRPGSQKR